jgi:hypothetical protein
LNLQKSRFVEQLQIFLDDRALLKNPGYELQTCADVPTFTDFVKSIQDESIDLTAVNSADLSVLCSGLGFADLSSQLSHLEALREAKTTPFRSQVRWHEADLRRRGPARESRPGFAEGCRVLQALIREGNALGQALLGGMFQDVIGTAKGAAGGTELAMLSPEQRNSVGQ